MTQVIRDLLEKKNKVELKRFLADQNPADIASWIEELMEGDDLAREELLLLYRILPKDSAADVFVEMSPETQEVLIKAFSDKELRDVLDDIYLDDTVDIIEEMPANVVMRILKSVDADTRKNINQLLDYPEDSAGSIMTIEFVDLKKEMTVRDAFARIRAIGVDKETIYTCYVTDRNRKLLGLITVKDLLLAGYDEIVGDIMEDNVISVGTHDDQEEVANRFAKYGFMAMPVVDKEQRLVGIITVDDVIDVMQEEYTEDMEVMAAIRPSSDKPYLKLRVFDVYKSRIPWLLILMISGTFNGLILQHFESALAAQIALTTFIPMLMDTGGNSGSQATVTAIRGLSLGEIGYGDWLRVLWKEARVAVLCGVTLAACMLVKIILVDGYAFPIALTVCATLVCTIIAAKTVGCLLPILAKKIGLDPAAVAAPILTTIVDAMSLFIYFRVATAILGL
ncbi:MAG: magnesium transporter [Oscillospiraceae bacterium]|nr:magnesium transporter [Oscillospiraceae bacterium]